MFFPLVRRLPLPPEGIYNLPNIGINADCLPFAAASEFFDTQKKYGKPAPEECCHDAILHRKCNYTYISDTISMYAKPTASPSADRMSRSLKDPLINSAANLSVPFAHLHPAKISIYIR